MAKSNNHKMALLYMMRELLLKTDEDHVMNATDLIAALAGYDCEADRRTIYSNVEILQDFGLDVIKKENGQGYYIGSRDFELPELKLLVDSVQSSKFITEKKSRELIGKLMKLTNEQKARQLNRSVFIRNRMKTGNEKVYYNVDTLHEAMNRNRQICFKYGEWNAAKELVEKKGGTMYRVSPWALTWDDENYYLIAFDEAAGIIKHYRVDKMLGIDLTEAERTGQDSFEDFDLAAFARKTFGMFGGPDANVVLRCRNHLAGVIIDRFGREVSLVPEDGDHFHVHVTVAVSPQFWGWVTGIGPGIEIVSPAEVREAYSEYLRTILAKYTKADNLK